MQRERERPVRIVQARQSFIQQRFLQPVLASTETPSVPPVIRFLARLPLVRDLPARIVGFGIRRPHVRSSALATPQPEDGAFVA